MAGGLVALLDDIAALVKTTAASLDDVAGAAGKAGAKAVSVVVDDAAVTPRYVEGVTPQRELPIIRRIAVGSIRNKLVFILPVALVLNWLAPWALTPLLMLGGAYLCFEGAEKVLEALHLVPVHEEEPGARSERAVVSAAVRTDLILSAEIMVIALNEVASKPLWEEALVLVVVALVITVLVYGVVGLIVKMDDMGLALAGRRSAGLRALGRGLVRGMPVVMSVLAKVGVVAMLWVGGHLLLSGADELGLHGPAALVHGLEHAVAGATGPLGPVLGWLAATACSALVGLLLGAVVTAVVLGVRALLPHRSGRSGHDGASGPGASGQAPDAAASGGGDRPGGSEQ